MRAGLDPDAGPSVDTLPLDFGVRVFGELRQSLFRLFVTIEARSNWTSRIARISARPMP
jgi:hypothetical protein